MLWNKNFAQILPKKNLFKAIFAIKFSHENVGESEEFRGLFQQKKVRPTK